MSYGIVKVYQTSIASGGSSAQFDLGDRGWKKVFLDVGSMSTASGFNVLGCPTGSGDFRQMWMQPATNVVSYVTYHVSGISSGMVQLPFHVQHMKFVSTSVVSGGVSMSVICSD